MIIDWCQDRCFGEFRRNRELIADAKDGLQPINQDETAKQNAGAQKQLIFAAAHAAQ